MKLVACRSCDVLIPEQVQVCPWCKTERKTRPTVALVAAAAALLALSGLAWKALPKTAAPEVATAPSAPERPSPGTVRPAAIPSAQGSSPAPTPPAPLPVTPPPATRLASDAMAGSVADGWSEATPTTWINVRSEARADAPVLRIVRPSDAVQVGPIVAGWRPVRGAGFSGWAGARHFAVASTP